MDRGNREGHSYRLSIYGIIILGDGELNLKMRQKHSIHLPVARNRMEEAVE